MAPLPPTILERYGEAMLHVVGEGDDHRGEEDQELEDEEPIESNSEPIAEPDRSMEQNNKASQPREPVSLCPLQQHVTRGYNKFSHSYGFVNTTPVLFSLQVTCVLSRS